ncbi:helix-turn-helix domain-containing protein [Enterococcus faecalis]
MKKILSKKDYLELQILEYLFNNTHTDLSLLSESLSVDKRTIRSAIQAINSKFSPIEILNYNNFLKLKIPHNYSIRYVYSTILQNSLEFKIIELCFFESNISLSKLENTLFISNSTLKRKLKKINNVLSNEKFSISLTSLRLVGESTTIQNFITYYIYDAYLLKNKAFKKNEYSLIKKAITLYAQVRNIEINEQDLDKATVIILVHFYFKKNSGTLHKSKNTPKLDILLERQIKYLFFPNSNFFNLYSALKTLQEKLLFTTYDQLLLEIEQNIELKIIYENFNNIINNICSTFSINHPDNMEKLLLDLCTVYNMNFGKPFILYDKYYLFVKQMMHNHSDLILFIQNQFNSYFENIEEHSINSFIYILVTHWKELINCIEQNKTKVTIALIYDTDDEHINMLESDISTHLHHHCIIQKEPMHFLYSPNHLYNKKYDLIITNIPGIDISEIKVLCLPIYPSLSDWIDLGVIYKELTQNKLINY